MNYIATTKDIKKLEERIFSKDKRRKIDFWSPGLIDFFFPPFVTEESLEDRIIRIERNIDLILKFLGAEVAHETKDEYKVKRIKKVKLN